MLALIPSPPVNGLHIGPAFIHFPGLMYVIGITGAIVITQRRWKAPGGDPSLVGDVALWAVPAGTIRPGRPTPRSGQRSARAATIRARACRDRPLPGGGKAMRPCRIGPTALPPAVAGWAC